MDVRKYGSRTEMITTAPTTLEIVRTTGRHIQDKDRSEHSVYSQSGIDTMCNEVSSRSNERV